MAYSYSKRSTYISTRPLYIQRWGGYVPWVLCVEDLNWLRLVGQIAVRRPWLLAPQRTRIRVRMRIHVRFRVRIGRKDELKVRVGLLL